MNRRKKGVAKVYWYESILSDVQLTKLDAMPASKSRRSVMKQQACIPRKIYHWDGWLRLAPSTGERFKFTGESGAKPLAMRWALVSTGAAPTAAKAAKAATTKVSFMTCVIAK